MNPMTIECDRCATHLVLTADLLQRVWGKSGRVACPGCGEKVGIDAQGGVLLLTGAQRMPEPDLELDEAPSLRGPQLSLTPPAFSDQVRRHSAPPPPPRPPLGTRPSVPPAAPSDPFDPLGSLAPVVPLQGVHLTADGRLVNRADEAPSKRSRMRTWAPLLAAALLGTGLASARVGSMLPLTRADAPAIERPAASPRRAEAELVQASPSASAPAAAATREAVAPSVAEPHAPGSVSRWAPAVARAAVVSAGVTVSTAPSESSESSEGDSERAVATEEASAVVSEEASAVASEEAAFSRDAATIALQHAAAEALACRQPGDPAGSAQLVVTFAPSGRVTSANLSGAPYAGTPTGGCIAARFRGATVPVFSGGHVTVRKTIVLE